jgi:predicted ATPase
VLRSVRIVDFKGIHDLTVDLAPLTVLVGPNAVGKTSVLEALYVAGLGVWRPGEEEVSNPLGSGRWQREQLIRHGADGMNVEVEGGALTYSFSWSRGARDHERNIKESDEKWRGLDLSKDIDALSDLSRVSRLRLDQDRVAAVSLVGSSRPTLRYDGSGLPSFLQYLHGLRDGTVDAIEGAVRAIVPRFLRVQFRPAMLVRSEREVLTIDGQKVARDVQREEAGVELWVEFTDGAVVPATHVSEGTLMVLALLSMVHATPHQRRRLLLIDDLDRALHPSAQHQLVSALHQLLQATPGLQIIATTHSPDLIDACRPEEVRVMGFDANGLPAVRALDSHPEAGKWLKLIRTGEFWSTVGEGWVAAGEVAHP